MSRVTAQRVLPAIFIKAHIFLNIVLDILVNSGYKPIGTTASKPFRRIDGQGMTSFREVMNVREASKYLGVSKETLYKYLTQDQIPAFKLGNRWRFKKAVLDRWMERQSRQRQGSR